MLRNQFILYIYISIPQTHDFSPVLSGCTGEFFLVLFKSEIWNDLWEVNQKIVFELKAELANYPERRLKEIISWILGKSNRVPLEAKTKIRVFYDYFVDFTKYDYLDTKYGIRYCFVEEEIHFTRESNGELWGIIRQVL